MPTGRVLIFAYKGSTLATAASVWDPETGDTRRVDVPKNLWCAGQVLLADGRVLVVGGTLANPVGTTHYRGLDEIWIFDPWQETWSFETRMRHGRWYPTAVRMADGRVLITSGFDETGTRTEDPDVEVYTPSSTPGVPGTVQLVSSRNFRGLYPQQQLLPDGRIVNAGPGKTDPSILNPSGWSWTDLPDSTADHLGYAPVVLQPGGPAGSSRVIAFGGGGYPVYTGTTVESIDAASPGGGWSVRAPLPSPRRNHQAVVLPDGNVLVVGGNGLNLRDNPIREAHLYSPGSNTWTAMAEQAENRTYHSTGLLLPDGTVASLGGDGPNDGGSSTDTAEIFEPTYLFRGARPVIASAPSSITWGQLLTVATDRPVARAVLMAPGAVTHSNDMGQRHVELAITNVAGGIQAVAPPSTGVAPAGWYMLFVIDSAGVPSKSTWVRVGAATGDTTPPTIATREPAPGATGVAVDSAVTVGFSERVAEAGVTGGGVRLEPVAGGPPVPATVTLIGGGVRALLTPTAALAPGTAYRVVVTTGIADVAGNPLAAQDSWVFTTRQVDLTPPSITDRSPAPGATGVGPLADVTATFSEPLDPATVTAASVTVEPSAGGGAVTAAVTSSAGDTVVTLNPAAPLAPGTEYRVRVAATVADVAGNALPGEQTWLFTTRAPDGDPPAITAREPQPSAANVPTGSGVTVTFDEPMDPASITSQSFRVGPVEGGDVDVTQITSSAGGTVFSLEPDTLLAAGQSYRVTLTTAVTDASGTPLAAQDTWTFTTAGGTPPASGAFLESGGQVVIEAESFSQNISRAGKTWTSTSALAGSVGTALQVLPNSGSSVASGFAATAAQLRFPVQFSTPGTYRVWLRGHGATTSDDSAHAGLNGAFVASADAMNIGKLARWWWFNATLDTAPATIVIPSAGTYTVDVWMREDGFALDRLLLRTSTAALTTDAAGPPESPRAGGTPTDTTPPTITTRVPAANATGVAASTNVVTTFSEALNPASVTSGTVSLAPVAGGPAVSAVLSLSAGNTVVTLNPGADLAPSTQYQATITTGVTDAAGNPLATTSTWTFTTAAAPPSDTTPPTITTRQPAGGAIGVAVGSNVVTTFNEALAAGSVSASSVSLAPVSGGAAIAGALSLSAGNTVVTLNPSADLAASTQYQATITTAVTDAAGNPLAAQDTWTFTTAAAPPSDTTPPTITTRSPAPGATGVAVGANLVTTFNEALGAASVTASSVSLAPADGGPAVGAALSLSTGNTVVTLNPAADLAASTQYQATITTAVTDAAGNPLAAQDTWTFTTAGGTPPASGAFLESGGQVVIEAESFSQNISRAGKTWTSTSALAGSVGTALQVLPNSGSSVASGFAATAAQLRFPVQFSTPGTYRVWLRGHGATTSDDSAHAGLNGAFVASADAMNIGKLARWWWFNATLDTAPATIVIPSAGTYTVDVWMREDGFALDRLLLRTSTAALTTDAAGPPESPRAP